MLRSGVCIMQPTEEGVMKTTSNDTVGVRKTMRDTARDKISDFVDVIVLFHE